MSTGEFPLWLNNSLLGALFFSVCGVLFCLYYVRRLFKEFPTKTLLNRVRGEVDSLSGDIADLRDRFSRFQKREGMREAREKKASNADLQAQAMALVNGSSPTSSASHSKVDLYKRARGH